MSGIPVQIFAGANGIAASKIGQLIVAPYAYNDAIALTLDVAGTGYNFFKPRVGMRFVVTGILLTADSNVTGSALIDVYEGTTETDTVIDKSILHVEILKNGARDLLGWNYLATEGKYINAKTDDDDVFVTMLGYYVPAAVE